MNIPDEVLDEVRLLDFDKEYQFIAEWARKAALEEAASFAEHEGHLWSGSPAHALFKVAHEIRALAAGDAS